ncbi:hypothetical protein Tco_0870770 [Tanacetum coccineum]
MTNKIDTVLKAITDRIAGALPSDTVKNPKLSASPVLSARSYPNMDPQCSNHVQGFDQNAFTIHSEKKQSESYDKEARDEEEEKDSPENIHVNPPHRPIRCIHHQKSPQIQFILRIARIGSSIIRHRGRLHKGG